MDRIVLSARLAAVASLVQKDARLIDVGTDHAYLPLYLARSGAISAALATDVAAGPIMRARENIARAGFEDVIVTMQTPGLEGTEFFGATDIVIAGMGGELIASILASSPYIKTTPGIILLLQPMTRQAQTRRFLAKEGWSIHAERLICDDGRYYQVIAASFGAAPYTLSPLEYEVGPCNLRAGGKELRAYLSKKKKQLEKAIAGKKRGHEDCLYETELREEIETYLF